MYSSEVHIIVGEFPTIACVYVSQFDVKGRNFLHIAVQKGDLEAVLFLLSVCVNVNSRLHDSTQMAPLHLAIVNGNEMIVRNLVCLIFWHNGGRTVKTPVFFFFLYACHAP